MADVIRMTLEAKLYYGTAGSTASSEITNVFGDLTQTISPEKQQINVRGSKMKTYKTGEIEASLAWTMLWKDADSILEAIQAAAIAGTTLAFRTKDYSAGKGWDADFVVTKFDKKEAKGKPVEVDVEIVPNDELRAVTVYG